MIREILCPTCQTGLAYSAALLGRTVQCLQCRQPFPVTASPDGLPILAPPLPSKNGAPPIRKAERDDRLRPRADSADLAPPRRPSGLTALLGLAVLFFGGFLVVAGGVGYLLWPTQQPATSPSNQTAAPPEQPETEVEKPKNLNDLLRENPQKGRDMKQQP